MTNSRDKFSGGGGDSRPLPQLPASSGDGKKTQRTGSKAIENWLTEGVQAVDLCTSCVQEGGFEGPENGPKQRRINNRLLSYRPFQNFTIFSLTATSDLIYRDFVCVQLSGLCTRTA